MTTYVVEMNEWGCRLYSSAGNLLTLFLFVIKTWRCGLICGAVYSPENTVIQPAWPQGRSTLSTLTCHSTQALTSHLLDSRSILKQYAAQSLTMYCKLPRSPTVHTCYSPMAGHEIGKKWSVIRDCFNINLFHLKKARLPIDHIS